MNNADVITQSRLRTLRSCAYKHHLMYDRGFRPAKPGETLAVGTLVHVGLEAWWLGVQRKENPANWLRAALDAVRPKAGTDEEAPFRLALTEELLDGYHHAHWREALTVEVIGVEVSFAAPLFNPEDLTAHTRYTIGGKMDVLIRDADGHVVIVEHKTTSFDITDDGEGYWQKLAIDPQISFYFMGAETMGHVAEGCTYDVIRKPGAKRLRATPEADRKYTKGTKTEPPRLYAAQRDRDETPDEYRLRVREVIASRPDGTFRRKEIPRLDSDIRQFLGEVWLQAEMMDKYREKGLAPRNPDSCVMFGKCTFWEHCAYGVELSSRPELWIVIDDTNPELTPASPGADATTIPAVEFDF